MHPRFVFASLSLVAVITLALVDGRESGEAGLKGCPAIGGPV